LLRGNTEALLLFLIDELGHTCGYLLIKEINRRSQWFFQFKEGTVYLALRLGKNPNLAGVLVVGPDCADSDPERIANGIAESGKPVDVCLIHQEGGVMAAVSLA